MMRAPGFIAGGATVALLATILLVSGTPAAETAQYQLQPGQVSAYPSPGVITASPTTQISFRGRPLSELGEISVSGSRSGRVSGRLRAHSDGRGASWIPSRRFKGGETVTVRTRLDVVGGRAGDWRFRIGRFPSVVRIQKLILENIDPGTTHRFRSRPDLQPPVVSVYPGRKPTAPGLVFLSPKSKKDLKQAGPMIINNSGQPVWFLPLPGIRAATDFRAQTYRGKPVLTYWQGTSRQGIGYGELVMRDQAYKVIARIRAPNGFRPDLHEFLITPQNTALLITYPAVRADLRPVGRSRNGLVIDSVIQEIDIATGLVLFEWHSIGKIAVRESFTKPQPSPNVPWDYVHTNGVSLDTDGDFLMSARSTWGGYKIDRETGRIIWRLGGKRSDFKLGPGVRFAWQHDIQRRADGAITVFDNSAFPPVRKRSRVLALKVDEASKRATLLSARTHPRGLLSATQGNVQNLPNGGQFVGWGSQAHQNEFGPNGELVWNSRLAIGYESYRAYRMPWVGRPDTTPRVAGVRRGAAMDVYASWNGATEVASWEVLGGPTATNLTPVGSAARNGFETRISIARRTAFVAVRAKDAGGTVLSTSPAARVR